MNMTDADRPAVHALLLRLEERCKQTLSADVRDAYFNIMRDEHLSVADVESATEYYMNPPWPPPVLLMRAHRERVERENHEADFKLAGEVLQQEPSERRDALLEALGFGKTLPRKPPDKKM